MTEVYYKLHQVLQSMTEVYYKLRQVLQSVTDCCKVRQVLQSVTIITKREVIHLITFGLKTFEFWKQFARFVKIRSIQVGFFKFLKQVNALIRFF